VKVKLKKEAKEDGEVKNQLPPPEAVM